MTTSLPKDTDERDEKTSLPGDSRPGLPQGQTCAVFLGRPMEEENLGGRESLSEGTDGESPHPPAVLLKSSPDTLVLRISVKDTRFYGLVGEKENFTDAPQTGSRR